MIRAYEQSIFTAAVLSLAIFCCGCLTTADYKNYRVVANFVMEMETQTWLCHQFEVIARDAHQFFEIDPIEQSLVLFNDVSIKARSCAAEALSKSQSLYLKAYQQLQEQPEAQVKLKRVFSVWESTMNLVPRFSLSQSSVPRSSLVQQQENEVNMFCDALADLAIDISLFRDHNCRGGPRPWRSI